MSTVRMKMNDINYRLITKKYREFFFPVLFISMSKYLTSFIDAVLVSSFLGVDRMPAVSLCFPVVCFISLFHGMFGIGGSLIAANAYADHDRHRGNRVFSITMTGIVLIGIITAIAGTVLRSCIVPILCSDVSLQKDVEIYYSVLVLGFPLMCLLICFSYFVRSDGCPKLTSYAMLISNAVNLCMDCVLMKFMGMGLEGAAAATIIGYVCGIVFMLTGYIKSPKRQYRLVLPLIDGARTAWADIRNICISGFSTASVWLYLMISIQVMNRLLLEYCQTIDIQAFAICKNSVNICYVLFLGIAQTLSPIVGVYAHSGDYDRVRFLLRRSIAYVSAASVAMVLLFAMLPHLLLLLYGVDDPMAAAYLGSYLRVYALAFPGIGIILLMNYYFQAINRRKLSTVITLLEGLLLPVGLSIILTPSFKMYGIMAAMIASESVTVLFILAYLMYDRRKSRASKERIFLLPKADETKLYEFSVKMDIQEILERSREVSQYIEDMTDHRTAALVCLALEEMLTGIAMANNDPQNVIDVVLRQKENDIMISVRDMGVVFDPLVQDKDLAYDFDNAMMLQSIAAEIRYDLSLGMNDTLIRLSRRT